jgi:hypothetical protein
VVDALFERALVALPGACASLDDNAAREMAGSIGSVEECVNLLDRPCMVNRWRAVLRPLAENEGVHALVRGWCCRLLLDAGVLDEDGLQGLAGLSLSPAVPAPEAAAWVEGVLRGSGLALLQRTGLWMALDGWLTGLAPDTFDHPPPPRPPRLLGLRARRATRDGREVQEAGERGRDRP